MLHKFWAAFALLCFPYTLCATLEETLAPNQTSHKTFSSASNTQDEPDWDMFETALPSIGDDYLQPTLKRSRELDEPQTRQNQDASPSNKRQRTLSRADIFKEYAIKAIQEQSVPRFQRDLNQLAYKLHDAVSSTADQRPIKLRSLMRSLSLNILAASPQFEVAEKSHQRKTVTYLFLSAMNISGVTIENLNYSQEEELKTISALIEEIENSFSPRIRQSMPNITPLECCLRHLNYCVINIACDKYLNEEARDFLRKLLKKQLFSYAHLIDPHGIMRAEVTTMLQSCIDEMFEDIRETLGSQALLTMHQPPLKTIWDKTFNQLANAVSLQLSSPRPAPVAIQALPSLAALGISNIIPSAPLSTSPYNAFQSIPPMVAMQPYLSLSYMVLNAPAHNGHPIAPSMTTPYQQSPFTNGFQYRSVPYMSFNLYSAFDHSQRVNSLLSAARSIIPSGSIHNEQTNQTPRS